MSTSVPVQGWGREAMARRLAQDIPDGSYINLGIGIPELVARFVPDGRTFIYHTENGLLGMGPSPAEGQEDPELINAGKRHVTANPGAAYFHHADSFAMIRGGHLDLSILGAMQISQSGDLATKSIAPPTAGIA
ncbi:MAG: CoA-transferase, partial [Planctomycetota bacterium]